MTDAEWIELGQYAMTCRGWRWLPGMRWVLVDGDGDRLYLSGRCLDGDMHGGYFITSDNYMNCPDDGHTAGEPNPVARDWWEAERANAPARGYASQRYPPDLRDPATLGCLLTLVREAWCDESVYTRRDRPRSTEEPDLWLVIVGGHAFRDTTEAGVLVAALRAAHRAGVPAVFPVPTASTQKGPR